MSELATIFNGYGTDKDRNGYSDVYESLFHSKRYEVRRLLEIGIGTLIPGMWSTMHGVGLDGYKQGASLRAWRDYFPNALIYGLDIQPDTQFIEPRIATMQADSRSVEEVNRIFNQRSLTEFDIIIDDGSHSFTDQMATLGVMMKYVRPGGTYIIEDIAAPDRTVFMDGVRSVIGDLPMFIISPNNNICVIANPVTGTYRS